MSQKETGTRRKSGGGALSLLSFVALICVALAWGLSFFLEKLSLSADVIGTLNKVATGVMMVVCVLSAYGFVRRKGLLMKIIYLVCAVIAVVFCVLGLF